MSHIISGYAHSGFDDIITEFKRTLRSNELGGAALSIYHQGDKVVDIWAGIAKPGIDWQSDTMALSYSTGKGIVATLIHRLVDQGLLDYDTPIKHYWPAFGANTQYEPTLRHVLCHESGLFDIRHVIQSASVMLDWQQMLIAYENAIPRFKPGTAVAYQALSFGWILGGLIEKVTGESFTTIFERELVKPLDLDGAYFGTPETAQDRIALPFRSYVKPVTRPMRDPSLVPSNGLRPLSKLEQFFQLTGLDPYDADDAMKPRRISLFDFHSPEVLSACIPSANGVFTARSLAKIYAMLAGHGTLEGQQYLSPLTFKKLSKVQNKQRDRVMPIPMHWRLGYHRVLTMGKIVSQGFGHMGYNGSCAWCDPKRNLSFAYIHSYNNGGSLAVDYRTLWLTQRTLQMADKQRTGWAGWF